MFKNKKLLIIIIAAITVLAVAAGGFFLFCYNTDELICSENREFISSIKDEVQLTFCAEADHYINGGMDYDAQRYGVDYIDGGDKLHSQYYRWTVDAVKEYAAINKKISLKFIKHDSDEFVAITEKYPDHMFYYGDILVTATVNGVEKMQVVNFQDIYSLISNGEGSASRIGSCDIETALSSAIATVISTETKKLCIISGHTKADIAGEFEEFFKKNNFLSETLSEKTITAIPNDADAVVIATPNVDFTTEEIAVLEGFLDNGGNLGKGLLYFASPDTAGLPNLKAFLSKWGVDVKQGILFEDTVGNFIEGRPTVIGAYPTMVENEITHMAGVCVVGNNAVLEKGFETKNRITVKELFTTTQTTTIAPVNFSSNWVANEDTRGINYLAVSISQKTMYVNNQKKVGNVLVFSTLDFFMVPDTEFTALGNRDVVEEAVRQSVGYKSETMTFIPKIILED